jgi:hypothetical protein
LEIPEDIPMENRSLFIPNPGTGLMHNPFAKKKKKKKGKKGRRGRKVSVKEQGK